MSSESQPTSSRDDIYFLESIFIKVEDTIFQVPRYQFEKNELFSTLFTLPPGDGDDVEGKSEAKPFELLGILKKDFRAFLHALYPLNSVLNPKSTLTTEEWVSVLALSDMWGFQKFRDFAIRKLGGPAGKSTIESPLGPLDKISLGEKYNVPTWFIGGCVDLINREKGPQLDELDKLGLQRTLHIYELREMKLKGTLQDATQEIRRLFGDVAGRAT